MNAVVLLSGGLDSATVLAVARRDGFACHCLTIAYGQRHSVELAAAERVAKQLGAASHKTIPIDLAVFGHSALTDPHMEVPKAEAAGNRPEVAEARLETRTSNPNPQSPIPITYVPARNTIFLAYALAFAEVLDAARIYIGVNAVDYSGYPDCRPRFIEAFQAMADLATRAGVEGRGPRIVAPLMRMRKAEIIRLGMSLGVDYSLTHSCYDPRDGGAGAGGRACGRCESCRIRAAAFAELGMRDPAEGSGS